MSCQLQLNLLTCPRCSLEETTRHLLWDCPESRRIWVLLNEILNENKHYSCLITKYEDIYRTESNNAASTIKMKIVQEMIQIDRPKNWHKENLIQIIKRLRDLELTKVIEKHRNLKLINNWENFTSINLSQ
jgi:hypothetical protein